MVSLIEELEAWEAAARVRVEELEAEIAELTARLEGERQVWSRLRVTRETVAQVLAELSGQDLAETAPLQEPVAPDLGHRGARQPQLRAQQPRRPVRHPQTGRRPPLSASVTSSTATSSTVPGRPGLGRSPSAAIPEAPYQSRHFSTVGREVPSRAAMSVLDTPSAASSRILARCTSPAGAVDIRVNASRRERSPSRSCNAAARYTAPLARNHKRKATSNTQH